MPELDNPLARDMMARDPIEDGAGLAGSVDRIRDYYVEQAQRGIANYFILMLPFGDMTDEEATTTPWRRSSRM